MQTTSIYAAVCACALIFLSARVIRLRRTLRVSVGAGGQEQLERAIRVQANFAEYTPFILLMMAMAEYQALPSSIIHAAGLTLLVGRTAHFFGFWSIEAPGRLRVFGMVLTFALLGSLALLLVALQFGFRADLQV